MSNDNSPNGHSQERRGSVTSAAFSNLFHRSNSVSAASNGNGGAARESVSAAAARDQRRRLSVTTLGLSGSSPSSATAPFSNIRRGSISTNYSDSIDENAIDDDEPAKAPGTSPFARRTSFGAQAMRNMRNGQSSPGSDNGYNWTEQLRSRAESSVTGHRPAFGSSAAAPGSPPRGTPHDRAKSVSDMPAPPRQPEVMKPRQPERPKPDYMQERILKGDFYMD